MCSNGETFDPFWDGPRLVPAFVTQLLAQAMLVEPQDGVETTEVRVIRLPETRNYSAGTTTCCFKQPTRKGVTFLPAPAPPRIVY